MTPASYVLSRRLLLRLLGVVHFVVYLSLWTQIGGLVGSGGILPARGYLEAAREQLGRVCYWQLPTLCWISSSDWFINGLCAVGIVLSLLLVAGIAPRIALAGLWASYLSLSVVGQDFLSFQWDTLLLETTLFAALWAPGSCLLGSSRETPPSAVGRWLLWWLLFKFMFLSGAAKLLSGDPTWRDLSAMNVHYETQPIPNWISWYAHQLPEWFQKTSVLGMFAIELVVPFFIFGPSLLRYAACGLFVLFQASLEITGNYGFFNLLTIVLCVPLLDDRVLWRLVPRRWKGWFEGKLTGTDVASAGTAKLVERSRMIRDGLAIGIAGCLLLVSVLSFFEEMVRTQQPARLPRPVVASLDVCDRYVLSWGEPYVLRWIAPLRTINGYGLFRVMTTERPELVIEGSRDGVAWMEYGFAWKPGDVERAPRFVAPHQPRLDWQMWFAALNPRGNAHWLGSLMQRLLEGTPDVVRLLGDNPFSDKPPRFVRLVYYRYEFTDWGTKGEEKAWWQRSGARVISSPISLPVR